LAGLPMMHPPGQSGLLRLASTSERSDTNVVNSSRSCFLCSMSTATSAIFLAKVHVYYSVATTEEPVRSRISSFKPTFLFACPKRPPDGSCIVIGPVHSQMPCASRLDNARLYTLIYNTTARVLLGVVCWLYCCF
jgi:hypothetical protein